MSSIEYEINSMQKRPIIVIMGATATGKSSLAIRLAKKYYTEIISADSMLVYKNLDIGTAKPTKAERSEVTHHMVDIVEPYTEYSVADYTETAHNIALNLLGNKKIPIVAGGTGQYINAFVYSERYTKNRADNSYREKLVEIYDTNGAEYLHDMLKSLDAEKAESIHQNNVKRVMRALELIHLCENNSEELKNFRYIDKNLGYIPFIIAMDYRDRQIHREFIYRRVDEMLNQGLLDEVKSLDWENLSTTAKQAIGYKELRRFLDGECSLEEALQKIKNSTSQYAKRQRTWFRRIENANWYYIDEYDSHEDLFLNIESDIDKYLLAGDFKI